LIPSLEKATIVTTTRTDIQYVVTENGIADLKNKSLQERAELLIAIADPKFREELKDEWDWIKAKW
jgi:4-hydroxybutyrate CoA-transferase